MKNAQIQFCCYTSTNKSLGIFFTTLFFHLFSIILAQMSENDTFKIFWATNGQNTV